MKFQRSIFAVLLTVIILIFAGACSSEPETHKLEDYKLVPYSELPCIMTISGTVLQSDGRVFGGEVQAFTCAEQDIAVDQGEILDSSFTTVEFGTIRIKPGSGFGMQIYMLPEDREKLETYLQQQ